MRAGGGRLVGVSVEFLRHKAKADADEMVFTRDLAERKATLLTRSDAIVVLVGGLGTLDEVTEILELRKHGRHDKPVVLLNTAGFYDGLLVQLRRMDQDGFLPIPLDELVHITDDAIQAAAEMSERYITDRFLPDKAIDLIDEAGSRARLQATTRPRAVRVLEERIENLDKEIESAKLTEEYEKCRDLKLERDELKEQMEEQTRQWEETRQRSEKDAVVGGEEIAYLVSK